MTASTVTPKGTLVVRDVGGKSSVSGSGLATFKVKRDDVAASLAISDDTVRKPKSMRDVVATVDWKVAKGTTINTRYDFGPRKGAAGVTWDGVVGSKLVTQKLLYRQSDGKLAGDTTVGLTPDQKVNLTWNNERLQNLKYSLLRDRYVYEPSYNFERRAPAVAVTRQLRYRERGDSVKVSYDFKSEVAAAEWSAKPLKLTASAVVAGRGVSKPTLTAVFENTYEF